MPPLPLSFSNPGPTWQGASSASKDNFVTDRKAPVGWPCMIQTDECDPGEICRRYVNRSQNPGDDWKLGCCRDTLPDLMIFLLPTWISDLHRKKTLIELCETNVHDWGKSMIKIQLTPGWGLPWLEVDVYEFKPRNPELLRQFQYFKDAKTGQNIRVEEFAKQMFECLVNIDPAQ
ncbi:hypothetical protein EJ05DRAFT_505807 [Pseudovirgaria hyperparasitica]|uniref:Uncharacterized protein n=1 Tax=Pseudovirgaria hyperparasitica TaxID=470096 RepID=A0A6A6VSC3_9PEZI|nr:uncharacterized protein EJ05DRAFT_505807 [Pseudovirgaria hyperparasitica]KAF2752686.1 hypothetical protein EJ05DRAFT_505807 [Pseudovirgaria hyperparasitica]